MTTQNEWINQLAEKVGIKYIDGQDAALSASPVPVTSEADLIAKNLITHGLAFTVDGKHIDFKEVMIAPSEAVGFVEGYWSSDAGWQYNINLIPSLQTDKFCESIDGKKLKLFTHSDKAIVDELVSGIVLVEYRYPTELLPSFHHAIYQLIVGVEQGHKDLKGYAKNLRELADKSLTNFKGDK